MIKILKNKYIFIFILLILLSIILYSSFVKAKEEKKEGFGYSYEDSEFIEPKVYPNIITEEDAQYILQASKDKYEKSYIVGGYNESIRKSKTCWLDKSDPVINTIIQRVCDIVKKPIENAEDLQIVKYDPNGYYNEHHDSCCDDSEECKEFLKGGGNRIVTMVIYLNDDFEGGATRFVNLEKDIKPDKYSGILFFPMNKNQDKCHNKSLHAGLPILSGNKYIANVWIRENKFVHLN